MSNMKRNGLLCQRLTDENHQGCRRVHPKAIEKRFGLSLDVIFDSKIYLRHLILL